MKKNEVPNEQDSKVEPDSDNKSGAVFVIEGNKEDGKEVSDPVEIAKADERFKPLQEKGAKKDEHKKDKAMDNRFKKENRKENWRKRIFGVQAKIKELVSIESLLSLFFALANELLNGVFIVGLVYTLYLTVGFFINGDWIMSLVGCGILLVISYITEKMR